ncbi:transcription/translation regulatory transformer protein RfaH [Salinicola avicenniae]|uniref:transcription/translation regulatory transformer protein RfaH n=1 Tax=Salinicola avicenniae TaxID=2916836 RepID=UPI002073DA65|nr:MULTISPECIES: transcription/translation regulatory transformer protein RfaH [unclassified Salinicola]
MTTESTLDGDSLPRWYVIQCKGGESFRASEHLDNQGYDVFHPVLEVQKRRRGKLTWVAEPLFPHYLFIRLDRMESNWRPIRSTRGVLRLVSFGQEPVAVQDALVETLRDRVAGDASRDRANVYYRQGDMVEITEGPFRALKAIFETQKGEERAIVLLNLLQQTQRLELPIDALRKGQS